MKIRWFFILILIAAMLIAWRTRPSIDDFKAHLHKEVKIVTPPVIEERNGFLYSLFTLTQVDISEIGKDAPVAVVSKKEKYLGLFGRFWKL